MKIWKNNILCITLFFACCYFILPVYKGKTLATVDSNFTAPLTHANVAVIPFTFRNSLSPAFPTSLINEYMFTASDSVKHYYEEISYHQMTFTGTVFDWVTIPYDQPATSTGDNVREWIQSAKSVLQDQGVDLSSYDYFFFVSSHYLEGLGKDGFMADNYGFSNGYADKYIFIHELGHAFGLGHANFLNCGSKSIDVYTNCREVEYGDSYDVMGNNISHFNGPHKMSLGWIPPSNVLNVTADGTYTVSSLTTANTSPQILRISKPDTREYYTIEYHQKIGSDSFLEDRLFNGVSIRIWNNTPGRQTRLIDASLAYGSSSSYRPLLYDSETFTDDGNRISVKQLSHTATTATVLISVSPNQAQKYRFEGKFVDHDGNPLSIPGLGVTVKRLDGSGFTASSNTSPTWSIGDLEIGWYAVTANSIHGYKITSAVCGGCNWYNEYSSGQKVGITFSPTDTYDYISYKYTPFGGDANGDGKVDGIDYVTWLQNYKTATTMGDAKGDFNGSGKVDGLDYVIWLKYYGI